MSSPSCSTVCRGPGESQMETDRAEACRREGAVETESYTPDGIAMTVTPGVRMLEKRKAYIRE